MRRLCCAHGIYDRDRFGVIEAPLVCGIGQGISTQEDGLPRTGSWVQVPNMLRSSPQGVGLDAHRLAPRNRKKCGGIALLTSRQVGWEA